MDAAEEPHVPSCDPWQHWQVSTLIFSSFLLPPPSLSLSKKKQDFLKEFHIWQSLALIPVCTLDERAMDYGWNNLHLDFRPSRSEVWISLMWLKLSGTAVEAKKHFCTICIMQFKNVHYTKECYWKAHSKENMLCKLAKEQYITFIVDVLLYSMKDRKLFRLNSQAKESRRHECISFSEGWLKLF